METNGTIEFQIWAAYYQVKDQCDNAGDIRDKGLIPGLG